MFKHICFIFLFVINMYGQEYKNIDEYKQYLINSVMNSSKIFGIDPNLLLKIIETESNYHPYIFSGTFSKNNFDSTIEKVKYILNKNNISNYKLRQSTYSLNKKKHIMTFYFNSKQDLEQFTTAIYYGVPEINFDIGIMQINVENIKEYKLDISEIIEPKNNILVGSKLLDNCYQRYKKRSLNPHDITIETIECYNKGFGEKKSYEYFKKVYSKL